MDYLGLLFVVVTIDQNGKDKPVKNWSVKRGSELMEKTIDDFMQACHQGIIDDYEAGVPCLVETSVFPTGRDGVSNGTRTTEIWAVPSKDTPHLVRSVREWCSIPNNLPFIAIWYRTLFEIAVSLPPIKTEIMTEEFAKFLNGGENA